MARDTRIPYDPVPTSERPLAPGDANLEKLRLTAQIQANELKFRELAAREREATMGRVQIETEAAPRSLRGRSARSAISEYGAWAGPIALVTAVASILKPTPDTHKVDATAVNVQDLKGSVDDHRDRSKKWHEYMSTKAKVEACRWRQLGSALEKQGYIISLPRDSVEWKSERLDNGKSKAPLWSTVNACPEMPDPPTAK